MRVLTFFLLLGACLPAADTLLIKSVDAGRTWTNVDPGPQDRYLQWFQTDSQSSNLYAITQRELGDEWHLLASTDGGQTWQMRQSFPREIDWISAAAATASGASDTLYLAYEHYSYPQKQVMIAKVTDGGRNMEQYHADGLAVLQDANFIGFLTTLKAAPLAPGKLYALVTNELCCTDDIFALFQALWVSADEGRNWVRLEPPVADGCTYPEMLIDPSDSAVYVACGSDLFKSADAGASWTPQPFADGQRIWSLQAGPGSPAALYGNRLGVIWKSVDGAAAWQPLGALPPGSDARFWAPHPSDPAVLFASTRDGVEKSEDGGKTWTPVTEYPLLAAFPFRLLIDPRAPDTLYLVCWMRQPLRLVPSTSAANVIRWM